MIAFIIQARLGSTRLPNKVLLPFYNGQTILDIILGSLSTIENTKCIVAIPSSSINDKLEDVCNRLSIPCFRGAENDVLQRFIDAAEEFGVDKIIRVCSDNPFLNLPAIQELINAAGSSSAEYISFLVDGVPAIKTHYGLWTEYVTLEALKRVQSITSDVLYHEHVTNFIYSHPDLFSIKWLTVPDRVLESKIVRLTIDTPQDFQTAKEIYSAIEDKSSLEELFSYIESHPSIIDSMHVQMKNNTK